MVTTTTTTTTTTTDFSNNTIYLLWPITEFQVCES